MAKKKDNKLLYGMATIVGIIVLIFVLSGMGFLPPIVIGGLNISSGNGGGGGGGIMLPTATPVTDDPNGKMVCSDLPILTPTKTGSIFGQTYYYWYTHPGYYCVQHGLCTAGKTCLAWTATEGVRFCSCPNSGSGESAANCNDGIDNDGDGLADSADPDCWGTPASPTPTPTPSYTCGLHGSSCSGTCPTGEVCSMLTYGCDCTPSANICTSFFSVNATLAAYFQTGCVTYGGTFVCDANNFFCSNIITPPGIPVGGCSDSRILTAQAYCNTLGATWYCTEGVGGQVGCKR